MTKARDLADLGGVTTRLDEVGNTDGALSNRSLIINGGFDVWQRSVSNLSVSANTYPAADRWKFWNGGVVVGTTRTEFPAGQTGVSNLDYYNSISIGANSAASDYALFAQHIENVKTSSDQTFTVSFYAKASQSWTIGIEPVQNFGSGGSARVLGTTETVTVGTSWARHTVTLSTASISGKTLGAGHNFELVFWLTSGSASTRSGGIGNQAGTFDITGVQLEVGDTATPFEHRSYGQELALCQRFFYIFEKANSGEHNAFLAMSYSANTAYFSLQFPVEMRAIPTFRMGGMWATRLGSNNEFTPSPGVQNNSKAGGLFNTLVNNVPAVTAFWIEPHSADASNTAYLNFDAEL